MLLLMMRKLLLMLLRKLLRLLYKICKVLGFEPARLCDCR